MSKIDNFFESKRFKNIINTVAFLIWVVCGIAGFYIIPGTTLQSQWAYGMLFGFGLVSGSGIIAKKLFWILYTNIPAFRKHIQMHWGNPE